MKIGTISLGCDKNRVDTEKMLARLNFSGHNFVSDENEAEVIIINTCGFTDDAKKESVSEILNAVRLKEKNGAKIIVTGCLTERYREKLLEDLPEVDAILGINDYDKISNVVGNLKKGSQQKSFCGGDMFLKNRVLTTPYHYAYLKIADGCSNHCTYCAIPKIRGIYRSESIENLMSEAKLLSDEGVKELILVAQDVTRYGIDFDGKSHLIELLDRLSELDFVWLRLLYLEPEMVDDTLLNYIKQNPKVCKYVDIPLQHIDDRILKLMNRKSTLKSTKQLVEKLKKHGIAIRSSFIVGFPSETDEEFKKLGDFIRQYELDFAGFFAYSKEEGTAAYRLRGQVPQKVKQSRAAILKRLQSEIIKKNNSKFIGKRLKILYDGIDYEKQLFIGRSEFQAPDIDTSVLFESKIPLSIGEFYEVEITGDEGMDLRGKVI